MHLFGVEDFQALRSYATMGIQTLWASWWTLQVLWIVGMLVDLLRSQPSDKLWENLKKSNDSHYTKVFSFSMFHMHRSGVGHCHHGDKDKKRNGIWNVEKCVLLCYLCIFPGLVVILLLMNTIRVCEFGVKSLPYPYYHFEPFITHFIGLVLIYGFTL